MQYQINISIDSAGLQSIYNTGQYVTFVKSVLTSPLAGGNLPIAWISFQPLEENQVTWIENYYIYTTTTMLQSGATISMTSQTGEPVQTGWTYTFAHGQFTGAAGGGQGTFNVSDQMTGANFNFGLAQQATINNVTTLAPLNAVPVLYNEGASFTPQENISIFLSSSSNNGTVISQVASSALVVTLTSQQPTANVKFNDTNNTFYPVASVSNTGQEFASRLKSTRQLSSGSRRS